MQILVIIVNNTASALSASATPGGLETSAGAGLGI
jgi:hypothetical protein